MLISLLRIIAAYLIVLRQRLTAFIDAYFKAKLSIRERSLTLVEEIDGQDLQDSREEALLEIGVDPSLVWWQNFYQKYFKLKVFLLDLEIPDYKEGFDWIVVIPKGLTITMVYKAIKKHMEIWFSRRDFLITKDDRSNQDAHYVIRIRKTLFAHSEAERMPARALKSGTGINLLECLIIHLANFEETSGKKVLDGTRAAFDDVATMCSGSRYTDGEVPSVESFINSKKMPVVVVKSIEDYRYADGHNDFPGAIKLYIARLVVTC